MATSYQFLRGYCGRVPHSPTFVVRVVLASLWIAFCAPALTIEENKNQPFNAADYPSPRFKTTEREIHFGKARIHLAQVRRLTEYSESDQEPLICRAWFDVHVGERETFAWSQNDIDAVGGHYGLFVPKRQTVPGYFVVLKMGDYDSRVILVRRDGQVISLQCERFFVTSDGRYLIGDAGPAEMTRVTVFDLKRGHIDYTGEKKLEPFRWYRLRSRYFFTEVKDDTAPEPVEEQSLGHFYDPHAKQLESKAISRGDVKSAAKIDYTFRNYEIAEKLSDCDCSGRARASTRVPLKSAPAANSNH